MKLYQFSAVADPGFFEGVPTPKVGQVTYFFTENYMKMKDFGPRGRIPGAPLDPPMSQSNNQIQLENYTQNVTSNLICNTFFDIK